MSSERIKIVQLITGLDIGGAERMVIELCRGLDKQLFDVQLVSLSSLRGGLAVYGSPEVPVQFLDFRAGDRWKSLRLLREFIRNQHPDLIHAHMFHGLLGALSATLSLRAAPAVCFTSHTSHFPRRRAMLIQALRFKRASDIIFFTTQHPHLNAPQAVIIPNGVTVSSTVPQRRPWDPLKEVRFVSIGSLRDQKNPLALIRAFASAQLPRATLSLIGGGPLEGEARELAAHLSVADRVIFHGVRADIRACLQKADIFVMHSAIEGMPLALLEAGAEGLPVISTPVGPIPEMLAGGCGWIAPAAWFADTMREVAAAPAAALERGQRLWRRVLEKYSIAACIEQHSTLYQAISQSKTSRSERRKNL
jgi:glycosyltransferase involved in cell wall biosynthesis